MRKSHDTNRDKKGKSEPRRARDVPRRSERRTERRSERQTEKRSERRSGRGDRKTHRAGRKLRARRERRSPEPKKAKSESPSLPRNDVCRHCDVKKTEYIQEGSTTHYCINLKCDKNDLESIPMADLVDLHNYSTIQGKIENPEFNRPSACSNNNVLERTFDMDVY
jgi:hypothetical protein